jgi:hypothetical protein
MEASLASTVKVFDYTIDIHGACVHAAVDPLCPGCLSDGEIDANIALLKADLDRVATLMKRAVREQAKRPLFDE